MSCSKFKEEFLKLFNNNDVIYYIERRNELLSAREIGSYKIISYFSNKNQNNVTLELDKNDGRLMIIDYENIAKLNSTGLYYRSNDVWFSNVKNCFEWIRKHNDEMLEKMKKSIEDTKKCIDNYQEKSDEEMMDDFDKSYLRRDNI